MRAPLHIGFVGKPSTSERRATVRLRDRLAKQQGGVCHFCAIAMTTAEGPVQKPTDCTLEHVVPRGEGGTLDASNCVAACAACNGARNTEFQLRRIRMAERSTLKLDAPKRKALA